MIETTTKQGIYSITNVLSGRVYIGSTNNLRKRLNAHRCALKLGNFLNQKVQKDYNELGLSFFVFDVIELVNGSDQELTEREQYYTTRAHNSIFGCYNRKTVVPRKGVIVRSCKSCGDKHYAKGYCSYHYGKRKYDARISTKGLPFFS